MEDGNLAGLGRTRPANELKMRCTELDESGNVTMVSGEYKKTDLIAKVRSYFSMEVERF
jgi:magnesium transporter